MDFNFVLEPQRMLVVAFGVDARQTQRQGKLVQHYRKTERAEKTVLGCLHVTEKIRVMHDADHVGVREFHAARGFEFVGHLVWLWAENRGWGMVCRYAAEA